jgi:hypothetical protein
VKQAVENHVFGTFLGREDLETCEFPRGNANLRATVAAVPSWRCSAANRPILKTTAQSRVIEPGHSYRRSMGRGQVKAGSVRASSGRNQLGADFIAGDGEGEFRTGDEFPVRGVHSCGSGGPNESEERGGKVFCILV